MSKLSTKEQILAALTHRRQGPPPLWIPTVGVTYEAMAEVDAPWPRSQTDPELMARLASATYDLASCPCCTVPFCLTVEAEAMGAGVHVGTRQRHPEVVQPISAAPQDLVVPDDFLERGRIPAVLEAVSLLARTTGLEQPVNAKVVGPFTIACTIYGPDNFLRWTIKRPGDVVRVLETLSEACIALAEAAVARGADVVTLADPTASGSLVSKTMYQRFVLPVQQKVFSRITVPKVLHVCGNTTLLLPLVAELPIDGFSFEEQVSVAEARRVLGQRIALIGNIASVDVLELGSEAEIRANTRRCIDEGIDIVAAGCALTLGTPLQNIRILVEAVEEAASMIEA